ncbi:MAG: hydroxyisourate hydrolase [Burkholderiaceae bacterium]|nr:hydroxyisourate hydrolase [Burkholderiaceae bacterium]
MGHLSTHVLDTMHGCPAAGMQVTLLRLDAAGGVTLLETVALNADGRSPGGALLEADAMASGRYRLLFAVGDYFRRRGVSLPDPAFLETVPVEFGMADALGHYHVPLLVSPWAYSTYRGS